MSFIFRFFASSRFFSTFVAHTMTNTYIFAMHSIRALPEILYIMFGIGTGGFLVLLIEVKLSIFFFIQFFLFSVRRICFFCVPLAAIRMIIVHGG